MPWRNALVAGVLTAIVLAGVGVWLISAGVVIETCDATDARGCRAQ